MMIMQDGLMKIPVTWNASSMSSGLYVVKMLVTKEHVANQILLYTDNIYYVKLSI